MTEEKKEKLLPTPPLEPPDPIEILEDIDSAIAEADTMIKEVDNKIGGIEAKAKSMDRKFSLPRLPRKKQEIQQRKDVSSTPEKSKQEAPESGRSFEGQSNESYCLECIEGHTMNGLTEMRHAIDRFRTAGKMTDGVTEKVRVAIREIGGIVEDVKNTDDASPEVKKGLAEILNEVRWIRKEYGISGKGLTRGYGNLNELTTLKNRILILQNKAYVLVEECPTCKPRR